MTGAPMLAGIDQWAFDPFNLVQEYGVTAAHIDVWIAVAKPSEPTRAGQEAALALRLSGWAQAEHPAIPVPDAVLWLAADHSVRGRVGNAVGLAAFVEEWLAYTRPGWLYTLAAVSRAEYLEDPGIPLDSVIALAGLRNPSLPVHLLPRLIGATAATSRSWTG